MIKRWLLMIGVATSLAGCDLWTAGSLDYRAMNYRQTCLGSMTNECVTLRAEYNIDVVEFFLSRMDKEKEQIVPLIGQDGYAALEGYFNHLIAMNEADIPNFFFRWFMGDGPVFSPRRMGEYLLTQNDFNDALKQTAERFGKKTPPAAAVLPEPEPVAVAPVQTTAAPASYPSLVAAIDAQVSSTVAEAGGEEYPEARSITSIDMNGDGFEDAVVLYTVEGMNGGNGAFQTLLVVIGHDGGYQPRAALAVAASSAEFASVAQNVITLKTLDVGPDDARCCPTEVGALHYRFEGNQLTPL